MLEQKPIVTENAIADVKKARLLMSNIIKTDPKRDVGWI